MLPALSPAVVAHIRRTGHRRYWILLGRDPATWLPVLEREAARPWPRGTTPPPSPLGVRLRAFARALRSFARGGFRTAPAEVVAARAAACDACPLRRPSVVGPWCGSCGCWLPLKRLFPVADCPDGRWAIPTVAGDPQVPPSAGCGCRSTPPA